MSLVQRCKSLLRSCLGRSSSRSKRSHSPQPYLGLGTAEVFERIYRHSAWGRAPQTDTPFYSGPGSHDPAIVEPYVQAIKHFLAGLDSAPDAVDLGCGDFHVGRQLREHCAAYVACDIVPALIDFNRDRFGGLEVDFRVVDITRDALPEGDVAFLRQVLQHLSNEAIAQVVPKLQSAFSHLILTEHLPRSEHFPANLGKPTGPDIRLSCGSGVVLTAAPFNLQVRSEHVLCEVPQFGGVIRTTAYELR